MLPLGRAGYRRTRLGCGQWRPVDASGREIARRRKDTMRYAIISDIHANLEALQAVAARTSPQQRIERIVCLGDIVGYHADPAECLRRARAGPDLGSGQPRPGRDRADHQAGFSRTAAGGRMDARPRLSPAELATWPACRCGREIDGPFWRSMAPGIPRPAARPCAGQGRAPAAHLRADRRAPLGRADLRGGHTHVLGIHSFDGKEIRKIVADDLILDMNQFT